MDNRELLSLLNENAKTKEEVLQEQDAEELRKQQEEKLKEQQNIQAFDQFLCDRFKEVLVEAVSKGLVKNVNGKRVVEGSILFIEERPENHFDYADKKYVNVEIENFNKKIINDEYYSETNINPVATLIPNCDDSSVGYRNFFIGSGYKTTEYTYKTFWGNTKKAKRREVADDEENLTSFINFFNSELTGVARIVNHELKYQEKKSFLIDRLNVWFTITSRRFFFKAEF